MANYTGNNPFDAAEIATETGIQVGQGFDHTWGGGSVITYLMRGWGTVSAALVYWIGADPTDAGAPEVVTDVVLLKKIHS